MSVSLVPAAIANLHNDDELVGYMPVTEPNDERLVAHVLYALTAAATEAGQAFTHVTLTVRGHVSERIEL